MKMKDKVKMFQILNAGKSYWILLLLEVALGFFFKEIWTWYQAGKYLNYSTSWYSPTKKRGFVIQANLFCSFHVWCLNMLKQEKNRCD